MTKHKFAESLWQSVWYATAWSIGFSIQYGTSWWFGGATLLGGPADWSANLWRGYPAMNHTFIMKAYYLVQLSFWLSMIIVTVIEPWRSDTLFMIIHHFLTVALVSTSFFIHQVRIGTAIMVDTDFADVFLPLAKGIRYLGYRGPGNVVFGFFAVAWYFTRHYVYFFMWFSLLWEYPLIVEQVWAPEQNWYLHPWVGPGYLVFLGALQILMLRWGVIDMGRAIWKAIRGGVDFEDQRSGEEEDGNVDESSKKKKSNAKLDGNKKGKSSKND
jgi:acyl-CoA-dependent ceramide synthase